ncbi:MAG: hypothetical protein PHF51_01875 [Candidatus ainarchaeum sp.]|nr:hypothetical protein [Candidatus ainarchaeum sp.]
MALTAVKPVQDRNELIAAEIAKIYPKGSDSHYEEAAASVARAKLRQCLSRATDDERALARKRFADTAMRAAEEGMAYANMLNALKYFKGVKAEGLPEETEAALEVLFGEKPIAPGTDGAAESKKSVLEFVKSVIPKSPDGKWDDKSAHAVMRFAMLVSALGAAKGLEELEKIRCMEPFPPVNVRQKIDRVLEDSKPKTPAD